MSEVVFVTPNFGGFVREEPVGTLLLATILRNSGICADILQFHHFGDVNNFNDFVKCAIEKISAKKPRIVSFYTRCDTYHISLRIAEQVKIHLPDVYIVFAGPQADLASEATLREIPYIDYICCGEGETTVVPFFSSLISGTPDHTICGLVYRSKDSIIKNPRPELIANLDTLPPIDYSLLDFNNEGFATKGKRLFPVDVGRGCPFSCTYCSTKTFWGRKYRLKSAERIIEEIKHINKTFGVTSFNFEHDMFTMNREKVIRICKMLKEIGFPIRWRCSARMDCLDENLIDIMTDAGMDTLFVGIESGSPRMQKLIQKNLKLDDIPEKLKYIASKGVQITASFIFGFPNETEEDFAQTMELMTQICSLPKIVVLPSLCAFFSGTELTNQYSDQLVDASVYSLATKSIAVCECQDIIQAHPVLFPHFREYKTDLREKTKYYPQLLSSWKALHPVYKYLYEKYYHGRICDILYEYTNRNTKLLEGGANWLEVLKQDTWIEQFTKDEKYAILKEVTRFLIWRIEAHNSTTEVFGFDVKALLDNVPIEQLQETLTMVSCEMTQKGNSVLKVWQIT